MRRPGDLGDADAAPVPFIDTVGPLTTLADRTPAHWSTLAAQALAAVLLAAVVALPLVFVPMWDDGYALPKALLLRCAGIAGAALFLAHVMVGGRLTIRLQPLIDPPLAVFAALLVVSTALSVDPGQSFGGEPYQYQGAATVLAYLGAFYLARLVLNTEVRYRILLVAVAGSGAVVAFYAVAQSAGFDPWWAGGPVNRAISSVGQPNNLAAYLVLVIVAALALWGTTGRFGRIAVAALGAFSLGALSMTLSRGGYVALAVALVVSAVPRARLAAVRHAAFARPGVAVGAIIAVSILLGFALPAAGRLSGRVVERVETMSDPTNGSIRTHLDLWQLGIGIAGDHPLIGTGPETFPLVVAPYLGDLGAPSREAYLAQFRLESPHNELIGIAAEMGLPALAAWVVFLLGCAFACVRAIRDGRPTVRLVGITTLAVLATHVTTTFFMTPEVSTSAVFFVMLGAGLATIDQIPGAPREPDCEA
jgi:O-antigen ligase